MIQSLSSESIHRICSSQVITSLATAVKELVENSIDAGATRIDIVLKHHGKESITVSDNGSGIAESDFEQIAKKHATSKIADFKDLESLQSFGFRGEALSSLCAMSASDLVITTKRKAQSQDEVASPFGYELKYNNEGELIQKKKIAYSKPHGTMLVIGGLFKTLPVRFKDFQRNLKREYGHLLCVLQQYAIIQTEVAFTVRNDNKMVINTSSNTKATSVRTNIGKIFGWKLMDRVSAIEAETLDLSPSSIPQTAGNEDDQSADSDRSAEANDNDTETASGGTATSNQTMVTLSGFASNSVFEAGRAKSDIQYFYVNQRPVDVPKISKLINQIYKSNINRHKYPVVILNMTLLTDRYDVNIDPNKRTVFIQNEGSLLEKMRVFFEGRWEASNMAYTAKALDTFLVAKGEDTKHSAKDVAEDSSQRARGRSNRKRKFLEREHDDDGGTATENAVNEDGNRRPFKFRRGAQNEKLPAQSTHCGVEGEIDGAEEIAVGIQSAAIQSDDALSDDDFEDDRNHSNGRPSPSRVQQRLHQVQTLTQMPSVGIRAEPTKDAEDGDDGQYEQQQMALPINGEHFQAAFQDLMGRRRSCRQKLRPKPPSKSRRKGSGDADGIDYGSDDEEKMDLSEDKMKRMFNKEDSLDLQIIGQFNKGFIIAKLRDDMFIIDQHATDEKHRFENLMKNCKMRSQPLLQCKAIQCVTPQQEIAIMENLDVFEANGFKFRIDEGAETGYRVMITSLPMSLNPSSKVAYQFGEDEILELASMLSESTIQTLVNATQLSQCSQHHAADHGKAGGGGRVRVIRPAKVRTVFAYKACRGAIMIGKPLTQQEMRRVVNNIHSLDQPWNCPHGRPTMRHLFDLSLLHKHFRERGQISEFGPFAFV